MTFTWTDSMKKIGASPDLEAHTRQAVSTAVELWGKLPKDDEEPRFNGGRILVPANQIAEMMLAAATDHLPDTVTGRDRVQIASTAFTIAGIACGSGRRGAEAWKRLAELVEPEKKPEKPGK